MEIDDKLAELENMVKNQAVESEEIKTEEILEESQETQHSQNNEATEPNKAVTIKDMSFEQVTEMAKKSNLVSTANDKNFVAELSEQNKDVLKASITLEREKLVLKEKELQLEKERIETEKEKSVNERLRDGFGSKLDAQEYHYKSLKPVLESIGMKTPMNIFWMWTLAIVFTLVIPVYPIKLMFCATFGNLIAGASADNRKGFAKGCMWTAVAILGLAFICVIVFGIVKFAEFLF